MSFKSFASPTGIALALALMLTGCTGSAGDATANSATEISFPDSAIGEQAEWVVTQLNSEDGVSVSAMDSKLSEKVTEQMGVEELVSVLEQEVKPNGPFVLTGFEEQGSQAFATLQNESGETFLLTIALDSSEQKLDGIHFKAN